MSCFCSGFMGSSSGGGGGGGGLSDIVDDTTPQLGGMLDVNGNALGDGTLELLTFSETASAVNHVQIANAATGSGPTISAVGDDTNVDLNISAKGSGSISMGTNVEIPTGKGVLFGDGQEELRGSNAGNGIVQVFVGGTSRLYQTTYTRFQNIEYFHIDSAYLRMSEIAAPSTPATNEAHIYLDSTSGNLMIKFDSGNTATIATYA